MGGDIVISRRFLITLLCDIVTGDSGLQAAQWAFCDARLSLLAHLAFYYLSVQMCALIEHHLRIYRHCCTFVAVAVRYVAYTLAYAVAL